jgi:hypothetical protein
MNGLIRQAIRRRDRLLKRVLSWERYRIQRNLVVKLIRRAKMEHQRKINTLLADPSTSAKKWWGISKSLYGNKCCSSLPDLIDNNIVISDSQHKAQVFNDYFVGQTIMLNADTADIPSYKPIPILQHIPNYKPWFLHVTWNKMEENANDFVNYVVVE